MKIKLDDGAYMPTRAHSTDAGLDIRSKERRWINGRSAEVFRTGVHIQLPRGTAGVLVSKSGLNVMRGITSTGLIDEGYTGEIIVKLYNHSESPYIVEEGDKISQLIIVPVMYESVEIVDEIERNTERDNNGFGSTGR